MDDKISRIRNSYMCGELTDETAAEDPMAMFASWMDASIEAGVEEPNAMALATASPDGAPSVRMVLLRGFDARGFVFYTNFESAKGRELAVNPRAALTFWWPVMERQVRVTGAVEQVSPGESDAYFGSRPRGHQLAAWASPQSRPVYGRAELERREAEQEARFPGAVPRPEFWGGFRLVPQRIEFWQGRENRLHDRILFEKAGAGWQAVRLAP